MSQIAYAATFDNNLLTTVEGLTVLATNPYLPAARKLTIASLARSDKSNVNAAFYNKRPITIRIGITRRTRDLLEQSIDSLFSLLQGVEKPLILRQSGTDRRYTSTYSDCIVRVEGGSYIELDLIFETSDHFGYDVSSIQVLAFNGFTSNYRSDQLTFDGSAPWQVPIITLTFTSITATGNKSITVANAVTGQSILISRTWASGDVVQIDTQNKTVKVNGSEVDFTGAIPEFEKGVGYWVYSDTFTARTFNGVIVYYRRYV